MDENNALRFRSLTSLFSLSQKYMAHRRASVHSLLVVGAGCVCDHDSRCEDRSVGKGSRSKRSQCVGGNSALAIGQRLGRKAQPQHQISISTVSRASTPNNVRRPWSFFAFDNIRITTCTNARRLFQLHRPFLYARCRQLTASSRSINHSTALLFVFSLLTPDFRVNL